MEIRFIGNVSMHHQRSRVSDQDYESPILTEGICIPIG
jgi:hypothetical protein